MSTARQAPRSDSGIWEVQERYEAENELDRFLALSVDLVCVVDVDGHFTRVSPSFTTTLGYHEGELLDVPFLDLVHPDDLDHTAVGLGPVMAGNPPHEFRNRTRHRDGYWVWLSWTTRPDPSGRTYAIARDVTEDQEALDDLPRLAAELELTHDELERFRYFASHDLQEPLRTIASYAELVIQRYGNVLDDDGREFLGFMTDAASRMRSSILALIDYSRLGRHAMAIADVDLNEVVVEVLTGLDEQIRDANARMQVGSLPTVRCDPSLISIVFRHLISNALKFRSDPGVRVAVSAERAAMGWRIQVADNGIGIKSQHHERIFELFKRLHPPHRYPGTGIGLAVCRKIVTQHGGSIGCTASFEGGAAFHFTLLNRRA